jgi:hypothetical protein
MLIGRALSPEMFAQFICIISYCSVRFEVFTAVTMKNAIYFFAACFGC